MYGLIAFHETENDIMMIITLRLVRLHCRSVQIEN